MHMVAASHKNQTCPVVQHDACVLVVWLQVVKAVDQLVMHELPRHVSECANLADGGRSDAMLAIYPGSGARFAKHIDNSADDGRRLTCLCYLNNNWREQDGGALRLFAPGKILFSPTSIGTSPFSHCRPLAACTFLPVHNSRLRCFLHTICRARPC